MKHYLGRQKILWRDVTEKVASSEQMVRAIVSSWNPQSKNSSGMFIF